ncbi:MAG: DUF397 domain-containing protein [Candidatus Taylorbacteria bacterium]|nr:DUF397 domain-containing protein [Candidatus Taylorbacteria bacterium]
MKNKEKKEFPVQDSDFRTSSWTNRRHDHWCVQVAMKEQGVALRDSKDEHRKTLFFTHNEWTAFIKGVKGGEFDL